MMERIYGELAQWWHVLVPPEDHMDEALGLAWLFETVAGPVRSVLELGSGGGGLASGLPADWEVVLVDRSEAMLAVSRRINPDREHVAGDMCDLTLGRTFDAVLLHDAVMYLLSPEQLLAAMRTAFEHTRPGGVAVFVPDVIAESFEPVTLVGGGEDADGRSARIMEWHSDPDPSDTTSRVDFAYLLREADGTVRSLHETHTLGLFGLSTWWSLLTAAGFEPVEPPVPPEGVELGEPFVVRRPG